MALKTKLKFVRSLISVDTRISSFRASFSFNRIELNRCILTLMGKLNFIPVALELQGKRMNRTVTKLRQLCWKTHLALSILYSLYINLTLVLNVWRRLDTIEYVHLGTHLARAILSAQFSYWAYQLFIVHSWDEAMLYEFAQSSAGEPLTSFADECCNRTALITILRM